MGPARLVFAVAVLLGLAAPTPGTAATLFVDDDGVDCAEATHTGVQAAVDDAAPGDTIRVCGGNYREQITIPEGKDKLRLIAFPPRGYETTLRPPPGGLTTADGGPAAMVAVLGAKGVKVRGFRLTGSSTVGPTFDEDTACGHSHPSAIAVPSGRAAVIGNDIGRLVLECDGEPISGAGVWVGDVDFSFGSGGGARVTIDRNLIGGTVHGVVAEQAEVLALRNEITGRGADQDEGIGVLLTGDAFEVAGAVRSNVISQMATGVHVHQGDGALVRGNDIHLNGTGVELSDQFGSSGEVRRNRVRFNGTGLLGDHFGGFWLIRENIFTLNTGHGILMRSNLLGSNRLHRNRSLYNGGLDCRDETSGDGTAGTANIWRSNVGRTDDPNVCIKP